MKGNPSADPKLKKAMNLHRQGKLDQAAQAYRRVLARQPRQLAALQGLAGISMQKGDAKGALALIGKALKVSPGNPDILEAKGQVALAQKNWQTAIEAYRACLAADPKRAGSWYNLGVALQRRDELVEAENAYEKALGLAPASPEALNNLANLKRQRGDFAAAIALYRRALGLDPKQTLFKNNLLAALRRQADDAFEAQQHSQARDAYLEALKVDASDLASRFNLGKCYLRLGRPDLAAKSFERVLEHHPERNDARQNLGHSLKRLGLPSEAAAQFREALRQEPGNPHLLANLAGAEIDLGDCESALAQFKQALEVDPADLDIRSNQLLTLNYLENVDESTILEAHRLYGSQLEGEIVPRERAKGKKPRTPLRVGLVSADLRRHSVACFLESWLPHLDANRIQLFAYFNHYQSDAVSERLQACCKGWREIIDLTDDEVADQIQADEISVLIDLSGHSGGNRLPVFARRPASRQVTWLGYPNTTGLNTIDYRLTDSFIDAPGETDQAHTEKLVRLPGPFSCYAPPAAAPPVQPPPSQRQSYVTFGSFNNLAKITPTVLNTWGRILQSVPDSRLLLKTRVLADPVVQARIRQVLAGLGIAGERLVLQARDNETADHLARYQDVDIALDPFPYNGVTTTCEALWCGVSVIALAGGNHRSRVCASFLEAMDLKELVADSPAAYVQIAATLAEDPERLASLREGMRDRMAGSPLMDGPAFAESFATAMEKIAAEGESATI